MTKSPYLVADDSRTQEEADYLRTVQRCAIERGVTLYAWRTTDTHTYVSGLAHALPATVQRWDVFTFDGYHMPWSRGNGIHAHDGEHKSARQES